MFYEGSEKKAEVVVKRSQLDLLSLPTSFWEKLVHSCQANIISSIKNNNIHAYLLSESSLFVSSERFSIITCGETKLIESLIFFLKEFDSSVVELVTFQRKNEYCSELQRSSFSQDRIELEELTPGLSYIIGTRGGHHNFIFESSVENDCRDFQEQTYEIFLYNISQEVSSFLRDPKVTKDAIRKKINLHELVTDVVIDDHLFDPFGYSLNAISKDRADYLTIHMTPQKDNSYISYESNLPIIKSLKMIIKVFKPESFDLIGYNENEIDNAINCIKDQYHSISRVKDELKSGRKIDFIHMNESNVLPKAATILD